MTTTVAKPPRPCVIQVRDQQRCPEPRAYVIRIDDCAHVGCAGRLWCVGHPVCVQHAAELRAARYRTTPGAPGWTRQQKVDVAEISNLAAAW